MAANAKRRKLPKPAAHISPRALLSKGNGRPESASPSFSLFLSFSQESGISFTFQQQAQPRIPTFRTYLPTDAKVLTSRERSETVETRDRCVYSAKEEEEEEEANDDEDEDDDDDERTQKTDS